jgi:hypothetical protein
VGSNRRVMFGSTDGKGLKTSPRGRFCRVEGCATVLSIYNSATECSAHERLHGRPVRDHR